MKALMLTLSAGILLFSCATFKSRSKELKQGQTEEEVVAILGSPDRHFLIEGGGKKYLYVQDHSGFEYYYIAIFDQSSKLSNWGPDPKSEGRALHAANEKRRAQTRALRSLGGSMENFGRSLAPKTHPPTNTNCRTVPDGFGGYRSNCTTW